jgi:hypothetical protein
MTDPKRLDKAGKAFEGHTHKLICMLVKSIITLAPDS